MPIRLAASHHIYAI